MSWLMLLPVALILAFYVLVIALARAAARGDRMWAEARDREVPH